MGRDKKKVREARKKINDQLEYYFPSLFLDSRGIEFFGYEKERLLAKIDSAVFGQSEDAEKEEKFEQLISNMIKPKEMDDGRPEITYEKSYESACITMSQYTNKDVKKTTVKEYFSIIEHIKQQNTNRKSNGAAY